MKNHLFWIGLLAVLSVACSEKEMDTAVSLPQASHALFAWMEEPVCDDSKTYVDDGFRVLWDADDRVSVFNLTTDNREYRFTGETGASSGAFLPVSGDGSVTGQALDLVYAVYPYRESTSIERDGTISLTVPGIQTYRPDSFGPGANAMVSCSENGDLYFRNLCGYLMLKLYGKDVAVSSITLRGNEGESLAGPAVVHVNPDTAPSLSFSSQATKEITLSMEDAVPLGTTDETATVFWLAVPPTGFEQGFTITVKGSQNGVFEKTTAKKLVIDRNRLSKMAALEVEMERPQPDHEIWYTSTDGEIVVPKRTDLFGAELVSNTYTDGKGILAFDGPVTMVGDRESYNSSTQAPFYMCHNLKSISLPGSVERIARYAFYNCLCLEEVGLPDHLSYIGEMVFGGSRLQSVHFPEVDLMDGNPLGSCSYLSSISGPYASSDRRCLVVDNTIRAFAPAGLASYSIEEGILGIGKLAFENCTSLKRISFPSTLKTLDNQCFWRCSQLDGIVFPEELERLGYGAFWACSSLTDIVIPAHATVGGDCFRDCISLRSFSGRFASEDGRMLVQFNEIMEFAQAGLDEYSVPEGIVSAYSGFYQELPRLKVLTLPSSLSKLLLSAKELTTLMCLAETPPSVSTTMLIPKIEAIYVPAASVDAYKSAPYWSSFADKIQALPGPEDPFDWDRTFYHKSLMMRFTATWCGYCPTMASAVHLYQTQNPGKLEAVNLHGSGSALYFSQIAPLMTQYGVTGFPTGVVDGRRRLNNYSMEQGASRIKTFVDETETYYPVSTAIAYTSSFSGDQLDIDLSLYVREAGDYKVTLILTESGIVGYQADNTDGAHSDYVHDDVARIAISDVSGDPFTTEIDRTTYKKAYSVQVPSDYNRNRLRILVYVQRAFGSQQVRSDGYGAYYVDNCSSGEAGGTLDPQFLREDSGSNEDFEPGNPINW